MDYRRRIAGSIECCPIESWVMADSEHGANSGFAALVVQDGHFVVVDFLTSIYAFCYS